MLCLLVPPEIFSHTNDSEVRRGDTATLYCVAHGHPAPVVTWLKDNQVLSSNRKITQPTANSLKVLIVMCLSEHKPVDVVHTSSSVTS